MRFSFLPALLNQSGAEWCGCLLILAGKVVLALRLAAVRGPPTVRGPGEEPPRFCVEMLSFPTARIGGLFLPAKKPIFRMRIQWILIGTGPRHH
jgi:hypothetical protein